MSAIGEPSDLHRLSGRNSPDEPENAVGRGLSEHNKLAAALIQPRPLLRRRILSGVEREEIHGMTARSQKRNEVRNGQLIGTGHRERQAAAYKGDSQPT